MASRKVFTRCEYNSWFVGMVSRDPVWGSLRARTAHPATPNSPHYCLYPFLRCTQVYREARTQALTGKLPRPPASTSQNALDKFWSVVFIDLQAQRHGLRRSRAFLNGRRPREHSPFRRSQCFGRKHNPSQASTVKMAKSSWPPSPPTHPMTS